MTDGVDGSALAALLARAVSATEQLGAAPTPDGEPVEGEGEGSAADGQVVARAVLPGRIGGLTLDPRAMRLASQDLAEAVVSAVNAALADLRDKAVPAGSADLTALRTSLERLRQDTQQQFGALTDSLMAAQDRLVARAGE
jgi:hypothetical protein